MNAKKSDKPKNIKLKRNIHQLDVKNKHNLKAIALKYDSKNSKAPKITGFGKVKLRKRYLRLPKIIRFHFMKILL